MRGRRAPRLLQQPGNCDSLGDEGAGSDLCRHLVGSEMWQLAATAPLDRDLRLAVFDRSRPRVILFPCRRGPYGWIEAATGRPLDIDIQPTHWREWNEPTRAARRASRSRPVPVDPG